MKLYRSYASVLGLLLTVMLMVFGGEVRGQSCTPKVRKYASRQHDFSSALLGLGGSITNPGLAIDTDPQTASSLNLLIGALGLTYAEQVVDFNPSPNSSSNTGTPTYLPGTPITLKLTLPASLLGVGTGVEVQAITNLHDAGIFGGGWGYTNVGPLYTENSLLSLLNGAGNIELTITPTVAFQGVRIRLTSALGVSASAGFFGAYVMVDNTGTIDCDTPMDILSGVRAGTAVGGILNATGNVNNPLAAIDNDPTLSTYAEMNVGVQVLSNVFHTTIFKTEAQPGDAIQMVIQKPGGGLLDLNVLNGFNIQLYNGSTPVGTPFTASSGLLSLKLLPGPTSEKYTLTIPSDILSGSFDRVEVSMGGVAGVGLVPGLRIYDVKRIIRPTTQIGGNDATSSSICSGTKVPTLSIKNPQSCTKYNWYTNSGTPVRTDSTSFTPLASSLVTGQNIFYAIATRTNCTETSDKIFDTLNVVQKPTIAIAGTDQNLCNSTSTTLAANTPTIGSGLWSLVSGPNAPTVTTPSAPNSTVTGLIPGNYIFKWTISNGTCTPSSSNVSVTVSAPPTTANAGPNQNLCSVTSTTLTGNVPIIGTGLWNAISGPNYQTGISITSPSSNSTQVTGLVPGTYVFRWIIMNGVCTMSTSDVTITVNPLPSITLGTEPVACKGTTNTSLIYSSPTGTPISYSIVWDSAAITAGFLNVTDVALPSTPIALVVPATASTTLYEGTITVKSINGCTSSPILFHVLVHPVPITPPITIH